MLAISRFIMKINTSYDKVGKFWEDLIFQSTKNEYFFHEGDGNRLKEELAPNIHFFGT